MGATRESSWSDPTLEVWVGVDDVASCEADDIYAKVSPGKRTRVQRVATRDRTVAPFVLEVIGPLSIPMERLRISDGTSAEVNAHFFAIGSNAGAACGCTGLWLHCRSVPTLRHLAESTGGPVPQLHAVLERVTHFRLRTVSAPETLEPAVEN